MPASSEERHTCPGRNFFCEALGLSAPLGRPAQSREQAVKLEQGISTLPHGVRVVLRLIWSPNQSEGKTKARFNRGRGFAIARPTSSSGQLVTRPEQSHPYTQHHLDRYLCKLCCDGPLLCPCWIHPRPSRRPRGCILLLILYIDNLQAGRDVDIMAPPDCCCPSHTKIHAVCCHTLMILKLPWDKLPRERDTLLVRVS